jgi:hypothetical protein
MVIVPYTRTTGYQVPGKAANYHTTHARTWDMRTCTTEALFEVQYRVCSSVS